MPFTRLIYEPDRLAPAKAVQDAHLAMIQATAKGSIAVALVQTTENIRPHVRQLYSQYRPDEAPFGD